MQVDTYNGLKTGGWLVESFVKRRSKEFWITKTVVVIGLKQLFCMLAA